MIALAFLNEPIEQSQTQNTRHSRQARANAQSILKVFNHYLNPGLVWSSPCLSEAFILVLTVPPSVYCWMLSPEISKKYRHHLSSANILPPRLNIPALSNIFLIVYPLSDSSNVPLSTQWINHCDGLKPHNLFLTYSSVLGSTWCSCHPKNNDYKMKDLFTFDAQR